VRVGEGIVPRAADPLVLLVEDERTVGLRSGQPVADQVDGAVGGGVVSDDQLHVGVGLRPDALQALDHVPLVVEARGDDADERRRAGDGHPSLSVIENGAASTAAGA
jgi:hypothetical protein